MAAARRATALVALLLSTRKRARRRRLEAELSPGDDDRRAAYLHALDGVGRTVDPRVQQRRPRDLGALLDLDLDAPGDPAMPSEMQRERSAADPVAGSSRTPADGANIRVFQPVAVASEAVDADGSEVEERGEIRLQRGDRVPRRKRDVDVPDPVVVELDR